MPEKMDARRFAALPDPFPMWRGGVLHGARIAYETWGELNAARSNTILLFTGLSPPAHAKSSPQDTSEGWWEGMIGPRGFIDTERYFVVCVNSLGSCFGSTGPASDSPVTGAPYRMSFPDLSVEDIARAGFETLRALGIERADTIIGPSLGGMSVLAFLAQFPGAARRVISISGTAAASPSLSPSSAAPASRPTSASSTTITAPIATRPRRLRRPRLVSVTTRSPVAPGAGSSRRSSSTGCEGTSRPHSRHTRDVSGISWPQ